MKIRITFKKIAEFVRKNADFPPVKPVSRNENSEFQINPRDIAKLVFDYRRLIACCICFFMLATAVIVICVPNKYMSTTSILPSGDTGEFSALTKLSRSGILTHYGDENSSALFPSILKSNQVKDGVLKREYAFAHESGEMKVNLADYFDTRIPDLLRKALDRIISIDMDDKTGLITISVETRYPKLSQAVLGQYLAELEAFNMHKRRSSAKDNVRYLQRELVKRKNELREAEDSLEAYQMANRNWDMTTDPEILKMCARLQRDIEMKSSTFLILQEQLEIAKLDAQKDVPIVRILDTPSLAALKSAPHRLRIILLSGIIGFVLALFALMAIDAFRKSDIKSWKMSAAPSATEDVNRLTDRVRV